MATQQTIRSRRVGLKDLYIALVTQNDEHTYIAGTPVKLARAISAKISDSYTSEKVYSDDATEDSMGSYTGTSVELEVNSMAPQDHALLFDRLYKNGFLVEAKEDNPPLVAMGYRAKQMNGKYEFVWYYSGKFDQGLEENLATIADKTTAQSQTIKASFYERQKADKMTDTATGEAMEKHLIRTRVDESNLIAANETAKAAIEDWFSEVQEPDTADAEA